MVNLEDIIRIRTPHFQLPVIDPIKKRFSPRVFSSQPIPDKDLEIIFEAARLCPSGRNHQPWFFYWMRNSSVSYQKILACVPERNMWVKSAPIIIIACYDPTEPKDITNRWALYDLGAASLSLVLQAQELGYYSRQIGSFDWDKTKEVFQIEDPWKPFTLIALGKIGAEDDYQKADQEYVQKDLIETGRKVSISKEMI